jgi:hypothetical protein
MRWITRMGPRSQLLPVGLFQLHAEVLGRLLDIGESQFPIRVGYTLYLIEARDCVADVRSIRHGLFALAGERESAVRQRFDCGCIQHAVNLMTWRFPSRFHGHSFANLGSKTQVIEKSILWILLVETITLLVITSFRVHSSSEYGQPVLAHPHI